MAADHPHSVRRLVLLDIAPTLAMYEQTTEAFARAYWHWFFLIQPAPLPERLIEADPAGYVRDLMDRGNAGLAPFDARALAEYQRCLALPGAAHGLCEDSRAAASVDLEDDRADREAGRMLTMPVLAMWGEQGVVHRCFAPLDEWRRVALDVRGGPLRCGRYIAEEAPERLPQVPPRAHYIPIGGRKPDATATRPPHAHARRGPEGSAVQEGCC